MGQYAVGIECGTNALRVRVVDVRSGRIAGRADGRGIGDEHPADLIEPIAIATRAAVAELNVGPSGVVGIGVACARYKLMFALTGSTSSISFGEWLVWQFIGGPFPGSDDAPGRWMAPGTPAGTLSAASAERLGLAAGIPVSASTFDTHAMVPGSGVAAPSTMVLNFDEGACHLMNSRVKATIPDVAVMRENAILPGYFGYELLPVAAGDTFDHTAFRLKQWCEALESAGVPVRRFVACGTWKDQSPQFLQILADVLHNKIALAASDQPAALGAAILGCLAAGPEVTGHPAMSTVINAMARQRNDILYRPDLQSRRAYEKLYQTYRSLAP